MKKLLIIISITIGTAIYSQTCDGFNKNTYQSTTSVWDWRDASNSNWTAWIDYGQATPTVRTIATPFVPSSIGQPNTQHLWLAQTVDYQPSEGWELVYRDFGLNTSTGVSNPHFILYNRFRGVMRIFYCITKQQQLLSGSKVVLELNPGKVSSFLESNKSSMYSNYRFSKDIVVEVPNRMPSNEAFIWNFADIPINYDPCTCLSSLNTLGQMTPNVSSFKFGTDFYSTSQNISQINQVFPASSSVIVAGVPPKNNGDILTNITGSIQSILGTGVSKGNQLNTTIATTVKTIEDASKQLIDISNFLNGRDTSLLKSKDFKLPSIFKQLPYIGTAIGFLEGIFGGGKTSDKNNTTNSAVPLNFSMTGTSTIVGIASGKSIYTPGCPHNTITGQNIVKPVYNYVMGIFALMEEPKIEAIRYWPSTKPYMAGGGGYVEPPRIIKYRLKNPIKFALNPASELQLLDIQTAIEYQCLPNKIGNVPAYQLGLDTNQKFELDASNNLGQVFKVLLPAIGPVKSKRVDPGLSYREVCEANGIYIANWPSTNQNFGDPNGNASLYNITFSTGFFNPECYDKFNFAIADYKPASSQSSNYNTANCNGASQYLTVANKPNFRHYMDFSGDNLKIVLKVKLVLRRTDNNATSNTEDIVRVFSYNLITPPPPADNDPISGYNVGPKYFYDFSTCTQSLGRSGVNFSIDSFGTNSNVGDRPLGTAAYPDILEISSWTPPSGDKIIFANKKIIVKTRIYANSSNKIVLRAGSVIEIANGGSLDPNTVETEITSDFPGCEGLMNPISYSEIQNICSNISLYNPNYNKSLIVSKKETKEPFKITNISLYPNPSISSTTLTIENPISDKASIKVYDMVGREVSFYELTNLSEKNDDNKLEIVTEGWQKGIYIVKIIHGDTEQSLKLQVQE